MSYIVGLGMDKQFFRRKYSLTLDRTCQCHFLVYYIIWHIYGNLYLRGVRGSIILFGTKRKPMSK